MPQKAEIPEISNRELKRRARLIRPVVSIMTMPMGVWPQEQVQTYFLDRPWSPDGLRDENILTQRTLKRGVFTEIARFKTFHVPGSAGVQFHPTMAEVLAQIPDGYFDRSGRVDTHGVIAFEVFLPERDPKYDQSGLHEAITVLLAKASPRAGSCRFHYSH